MNLPTTKRPELSAETKAAHEVMIQGRAPSTWQFVPEELKPPPAGGAARSPNTSALGSLPAAAVVDSTDGSQTTPADKVKQMVGYDRLCVPILLDACPAATMAGRMAAAPTSKRLATDISIVKFSHPIWRLGLTLPCVCVIPQVMQPASSVLMCTSLPSDCIWLHLTDSAALVSYPCAVCRTADPSSFPRACKPQGRDPGHDGGVCVGGRRGGGACQHSASNASRPVSIEDGNHGTGLILSIHPSLSAQLQNMSVMLPTKACPMLGTGTHPAVLPLLAVGIWAVTC